MSVSFFFFNDTATTEIYTYGHTLSLHDALPISGLGAIPRDLQKIDVRRHHGIGQGGYGSPVCRTVVVYDHIEVDDAGIRTVAKTGAVEQDRRDRLAHPFANGLRDVDYAGCDRRAQFVCDERLPANRDRIRIRAGRTQSCH